MYGTRIPFKLSTEISMPTLSSHKQTTFYHYLMFIQNKGYTTRELWSSEGWDYLLQNNISSPIYWLFRNNIWYVRIFDKTVPVSYLYNYPMTFVNFYEAEACCKYYKGRLPTKEDIQILEEKQEANWPYDFSYACMQRVWEWCADASLYGIPWPIPSSAIQEPMSEELDKLCRGKYTGFRVITL
tara:strand:- start:944 stop:1495 length:552 start_codon:yes stop_codon:yes gene_type:complete